MDEMKNPVSYVNPYVVKIKSAVSIKIQRFFLIFKWYLQESNQGHKDFQSFALPTELRYQHFYLKNNIQSFALPIPKQFKISFCYCFVNPRKICEGFRNFSELS